MQQFIHLNNSVCAWMHLHMPLCVCMCCNVCASYWVLLIMLKFKTITGNFNLQNKNSEGKFQISTKFNKNSIESRYFLFLYTVLIFKETLTF